MQLANFKIWTDYSLRQNDRVIILLISMVLATSFSFTDVAAWSYDPYHVWRESFGGRRALE